MALKRYTQPGGGFIRRLVLEVPGITLDASAVDAGHVGFETHLRRGLALGKISGSGKYAQYDDTAQDGTQTCLGYLFEDVDMLDGGSEAVDRPGVILVLGLVDRSKVFGSDAAAEVDLTDKIWHV